MTLVTESRRAPASTPITDLLAERWSPRAFDSSATIDDATVASLLEAARWAPSAANFQPRRFIAARRGSASFDLITNALAEGNQPWAPNASLYIVAIALTEGADGRAYRWADYDAGQAIAHLTVQAHALGLHVHQVGGFSPEALAEAFDLPATAIPVTVSIIGTVAPADTLAERFQARETADRTRLPLEELVLVND